MATTSSMVTDRLDGLDDLDKGLLSAPTRTFHWADYCIFALTLVVAMIIGLYYGIKNRRTMSVKEMLLGGKDLGSWPVSLSLVGTLASTIFVLGVPSEVYYGGEWPLYLALAFIPATVITVHIFIPIFHSLGVTSAYEYLGLRFNKIIRFMAALIFIVMMNFTQSLAIYTPAVGFSLVAGVSMEVSILTAGVVCTFYTALGGLRAVIVTDIFQVSTMLAGVLGMLIKGSIDAGGIENIFKVSSSGERLQLWSMNWTLNTTYSFWSQFFGGTVIFLGLFAANQQSVQRYCAVKTCRGAQKAAYISMVFYIIAWVLVLLVGLVIYAFYYSCDPLVLNVIYSPDQVLPLFIMDTIGHLHGIPGLFSAAVFGAVLSSVSSGINSLAAVTLEDVIKPVHHRMKKTEITEVTEKSIVRALALFYGALTIGLSYIPVKIGTYILNIDVTFSAFGVLGGPVIGAFVLGIMIPVANSLGAGVGLIGGLLFGLWMWIGRMVCRSGNWVAFKRNMPSECHHYYNLTGFIPHTPDIFPGKGLYENCPLQEMYDISYLWYGFITMGITILLGVVVSLMSGGHGGKRVSPDLLCWDRFKRKWKERAERKKRQSKWPFVDTNVVPPVPNPLIMKSDVAPSMSGGQPVVYPSCQAEDDVMIYSGGQLHTDPSGVLHQPGSEKMMFQNNVPSRIQGGGYENNGYICDTVFTDHTGVLHQPNDQDAALFANGVVVKGQPVCPQESALYQPGDPGPAVFNNPPLPSQQTTVGYIEEPQPTINVIDHITSVNQDTIYCPPGQYPQAINSYVNPTLGYSQASDNYTGLPITNDPYTETLNSTYILPGTETQLTQRHVGGTANISPLWS